MSVLTSGRHRSGPTQAVELRSGDVVVDVEPARRRTDRPDRRRRSAAAVDRTRRPARSAGVRTRWHRGPGDSATDGSSSTARTHQLDAEPHRRRRQPARHPRHRVRRGMDPRPIRRHDTAALHCAARPRRGWPFGGTARQTIVADRLGRSRCELSRRHRRRAVPRRHRMASVVPQAGPADVRADARCTAGTASACRTPSWCEPIAGPWDDTFVNTDPVTLHYPGTTDVARRSRSRPTATTGWCTTSPRTPRASNRSPVRRTRSTMRPRLVTPDAPAAPLDARSAWVLTCDRDGGLAARGRPYPPVTSRR